jgi:hypothetical protein
MRAIKELRNLGYELNCENEKIIATYTRQGHPDPVTVKPLLAELKEHKAEAIAYLRQQTPGPLYQQMEDDLERLWQAGTQAYIEQHRPELAQEVDTAEATANEAWLACEAPIRGVSRLRGAG